MAFHTDRRSYDILVEIGEGAYGKVYKARELCEQQRLVAVKKLTVLRDPECGIPAFMIREVAVLRKIEHFNHPNIVKLLDVCARLQGRGMELGLVFEYIDQDLTTYLSKVPRSGLDIDRIKDVMSQLLRGLDFLHSNLVVHRDLKPDNVLVGSRGEIKIADFGLVLLSTTYMSSVDIWSAGCILAELFLLKPLFRGFTEMHQLREIFE
ncbi:hypothetical protein NHX12_031302 [Muraenolepis orangiensis]|uniref:cyclin-dependent kinase n=1 Tax=Muraenolepis orangiensis TaxID=630683 RepID=A0A9Q0E9D3_9TELE|nr:hypothetical protein NHX12_031302 [Muraenolepis orangiensis]